MATNVHPTASPPITTTATTTPTPTPAPATATTSSPNANAQKRPASSALGENESDFVEFIPLGGGCEVGRSCHILRYKGKTIMLDCGLHPAYSGISSLPYLDEIDMAEIDIILISHFHLDHAAGLPYLLEHTDFKGRVFMTHPTKSIYKLILQDYVKVSSLSVEESLYSEEDLFRSMEKIEAINYHQVVQHKGVRFWAYNAGHVLGAAMFMIEIAGVKLLYTGDYSRRDDRHLMAAELPENSPDILVVESTYGVQTLSPVEEREKRFCGLIKEIVYSRQGRCLIPVFALGRTQELLLILDEFWSKNPALHGIPIYYASALAKKCLTVYATYVNMMNKHIQARAQLENPFHFKHIYNLKSISHFEDTGPCVVMASPGMLQNGLSRELLELWASDESNGVIIPGYAVDGTLAKHIMSEPTHISALSGQRIPLRLSVHYISFSAHADYTETSQFVNALLPPHVILVHGEANEGVGRLKGALLEKHGRGMNGRMAMNVLGPRNCQTVSIEFRQQKMVRTVGKLALDGAAEGRILRGVLVKKDFSYQLMATDDLPNFTSINSTVIRQSLVVPFFQTFQCLKDVVSRMFDLDEEEEMEKIQIHEEETQDRLHKLQTQVKVEGGNEIEDVAVKTEAAVKSEPSDMETETSSKTSSSLTTLTPRPPPLTRMSSSHYVPDVPYIRIHRSLYVLYYGTEEQKQAEIKRKEEEKEDKELKVQEFMSPVTMVSPETSESSSYPMNATPYVKLEWESNPVHDMLADSVVTLLMNVQSNPGGARLIGSSGGCSRGPISNHHDHDHDVEVEKGFNHEHDESGHLNKKLRTDEGNHNNGDNAVSIANPDYPSSKGTYKTGLLKLLTQRFGEVDISSGLYKFRVIEEGEAQVSVDPISLKVTSEDPDMNTEFVRQFILRAQGALYPLSLKLSQDIRGLSSYLKYDSEHSHPMIEEDDETLNSANTAMATS